MLCQKELFNLPEGLHYLNCAYMSPLPTAVEMAGNEGIQKKRNPVSISPEDFFNPAQKVRSLFARLINAGSSTNIALIPSVSYGMASVSKNTRLSAGQNIVLVHEQFPSNVYPWLHFQHDGIRIITVANEFRDKKSVWNERLLDAIDHRTGLVAIPNVHWADGTKFDLAAIGSRCRDVGARLVVDATQSVGALPFDQSAVQADAVICAGYKWLMGPYSTGLAYFGDAYQNGSPLEETWMARQGSKNFAGLVDYQPEYQEGAARFNVGESSNFILLPMLRAALELILEWSPENIQSYCAQINSEPIRRLKDIGLDPGTAGNRADHLWGIPLVESIDRQVLSSELRRREVSVSFRGDFIRVSPNVYNTVDDIHTLVDAIEIATQKTR